MAKNMYSSKVKWAIIKDKLSGKLWRSITSRLKGCECFLGPLIINLLIKYDVSKNIFITM